MKILVLNCGSSSVKFQLLEMDNEELICKGIVEKIGSSQATLRYQPRGRPEIKEVLEVLDHQAAIKLVISTIMHPTDGVINDKSEIEGIGHRTVHGGEEFSQSVLIDEHVIECIERHHGLGCSLFVIEFFGRDTKRPARLFAEKVIPAFRT